MEEQLYDGTAESVKETIHPGIIQLSVFNNNFDGRLLLEWVDHLEKNGLDGKASALHQLLWGMTPTEQYAIVGDTGESEATPLASTNPHTGAAD
jgi:hypothetical protein